MKDLKGKTILITGGASGIGRAVARRFLEEGARVALWDVDAKGLKEAVAALSRETGGEVRGDEVDVIDRIAVYAAAKRLAQEFGDVDILDNNAGVVAGGDFLDVPDAALARTVEVNLLSYLWTLKAFLPAMKRRRRGRVIMMASAAGLLGVPGMAVYAATKQAVIGLAESLRLELRKEKSPVGMTIVCPSFVDTGMFEGGKPPRGAGWLKPDDLARAIVAAVKAGRVYVREPFLVKLIPSLKALPSQRARDWLGDLTGMHESMEGWKGRRR